MACRIALAGAPSRPVSNSVYSESSYLAGDLRTPVIVRAAIANGVQVLDLDRQTARQLVVIGANDLNDDADVNGTPRGAQVEDGRVRLGLSRPCRRRLCCSCGARHRAGTKVCAPSISRLGRRSK